MDAKQHRPEFQSWRSFQEFARLVRHGRRYVWTKEMKAFLDTVLATMEERIVKISQGTLLFRAQHGARYELTTDDEGNEIGEELVGYGAERMKPLADRAKEGRINPAGIPVLYLASSIQTAISETRPWVGSELSMAQFEVLRDLKAVDLSRGHGQMSIGHLTFDQLLGDAAVDADTKEKAVWIDIDNAFSRPVTRSDDAAEYAPTQILAELFRNAGYDAIIYRSQFGEKGYNIALFTLEDAVPINCAPYQVTAVEVAFKEAGNRWFSMERQRSRKAT